MIYIFSCRDAGKCNKKYKIKDKKYFFSIINVVFVHFFILYFLSFIKLIAKKLLKILCVFAS
jgi:hypothetical protein